MDSDQDRAKKLVEHLRHEHQQKSADATNRVRHAEGVFEPLRKFLEILADELKRPEERPGGFPCSLELPTWSADLAGCSASIGIQGRPKRKDIRLMLLGNELKVGVVVFLLPNQIEEAKDHICKMVFDYLKP